MDEKEREYQREWKRQQRIKAPEKVRAYARLKYQRMKSDPAKLEKHRAYMRAYQAEWRKDNPRLTEYRRNWMREWHKQNATRIYQMRRKRPYERLASIVRSRINDCLRNRHYKSAKTAELVGCSSKELHDYLEKMFLPGMTWDNYGLYGWHVDHIQPLASFDLSKPEEQKKAFHFTNLQPLWAKDNLKKHASFRGKIETVEEISKKVSPSQKEE